MKKLSLKGKGESADLNLLAVGVVKINCSIYRKELNHGNNDIGY